MRAYNTLRNFSIACLLLFALTISTVSAQIIEKYVDNGPDSKRLTLVVTGDGYTAAEQTKFRNDAINLINFMLNTSPWDTYVNVVNVYLVGAISNQSGADKPPLGIYVDTIFNGSYWVADMERLLAVDNSKVFSYVAARVPTYDFVFVIVNDEKYGGSGGSVSVTSIHSSAKYILIHEVGHSYAHLADEYDYGSDSYSGPEPSEPNVTLQTNRDLIKWKGFIDPSTPIPTIPQSSYPTQVGLFEGAYYCTVGVYRPVLNCEMRSLAIGFCPVCKETHVRAIHNYAPMVDQVIPVTGTITVDSQMTFSAAGQNYQYLTREWVLDGVLIGSGESITLSPIDVKYPSSKLLLRVIDANPMIVNYAKPMKVYTWTLLPVPTPVASIGQARELPQGSYVTFPAVVSVAYTDAPFLPRMLITCGIRVIGTAAKPEKGKLVTLTGSLDGSGPMLTLANAQCVISPEPSVSVAPLGMSCISVGGQEKGLQKGVLGGIGLNNVNLLVKVAGRCTYSTTGYFYIDDGSNLSDGSGRTGIKVYGKIPVSIGENPVGKFVSVVGISYAEDSPNGVIRAIKARSINDVVKLQ